MAKKSEYTASFEKYKLYVNRFTNAVNHNHYIKSLEYIQYSIPYFTHSLIYMKKVLKIDNPNISLISSAADIAPAVFNTQVLDRIEKWSLTLKRQHRDIAASVQDTLATARQRYTLAAEIWNTLAAGKFTSETNSHKQPESQRIVEIWLRMRTIRPSRRHPGIYHFTVNFDKQVRWKCNTCGLFGACAYHDALGDAICQTCQRVTQRTLLP